jgi:ribosomal protein S27E
MGAGSTIIYKHYYNKGRHLLEPEWGDQVPYDKGQIPAVQCPTCGSTSMKYSAHPDNPEEITHENVRCENCGRITYYYEAFKHRKEHPCVKARKVVKV